MNKNRLIAMAFVLSVSLNLLFIGAIAGRHMSGPHPRDMAPPLGRVLRDLDEDTRNELQPRLEDHARIIAPLREEMNAARSEFRKLLSKKEIDEVALQKSLSRLHMASDDFQSTMLDQMVMILKDLEPEQRKKVSRFLIHFPEDGKRRRRPRG
jgi:uncharacterized membrane protein|tara:strand:+ start:570 stop:1028 length:459 start_codon:yes stop_codon:yes gene_type:complete